VTHRPTLDDTLQALRGGSWPWPMTKAACTALAKGFERHRAFEQYIRGAATVDGTGYLPRLVATFDSTFADPNSSTPATTREHQ